MLKFKYNCLSNTLAYQKGEHWYEVNEQFEGNFGSLVFKLDNGWISFTIYEKQIKVFAREDSEEDSADNFWNPPPATYYRKYLPKFDEVTFTFTERDEVEKVNGKWGRKCG